MPPVTRAQAAAKKGGEGRHVPPKAPPIRKPPENSAREVKKAANKTNAGEKGPKNKNGKRKGGRPKKATPLKDSDHEEDQQDPSPTVQTDNGEPQTSTPSNSTQQNPEQSMTNAEYDLRHAVQFDLVLGFHQELLISSRIMHKRLMSGQQMPNLTPEEVAHWMNGPIQKELPHSTMVIPDQEWTNKHKEKTRETVDEKQRFEGTQRYRYEGWYFQLPEIELVKSLQDGYRINSDGEELAGSSDAGNLYSFFRHEPSGIAGEVLQRPVTRRNHVYYKLTDRPIREICIKKGAPGRHDFAQILLEHNDHVRGIRSRRIAQCLLDKEKTEKDVGKCMSFPCRAPFLLFKTILMGVVQGLLMASDLQRHSKKFIITRTMLIFSTVSMDQDTRNLFIRQQTFAAQVSISAVLMDSTLRLCNT